LTSSGVGEVERRATATSTVTLPAESAYRDELMVVLREPPVGADQLPANVPVPEGAFPG
jgi:hypothetical protein